MTTTNEEATRPPAPLRLVSIFIWQMLVLLAGLGVLYAIQRGSAASLLAGAALLSTSLLLTRRALAYATRQHEQPARGLLMVLLKTGLMLLVMVVGFATDTLGLMSFAAGATTLPVAITLDACYPMSAR
ncbi:MAG: hypothetical protein VCC00_15785 [Deltaproteobacteria bacterium]